MSCEKKIAIAIPTYDRNELLVKLLKTIPDDVLVFISDNGGKSTNSDFFQDKNYTVSVVSDLSMFENWNNATSIAECDYIAITSDDDLYLPGAFDVVRDKISSTDADVYIFGHLYVDSGDNVIGSYKINKFSKELAPNGFLKYKFGVDSRMPSIFFKKSFLDEIGHFDIDNFSFTAADSELIQRALLKGSVAFFPEQVSCYKVWGGGYTDKKIATKEWLEQIDNWTKKIIELGVDESSFFSEKFSKKYSDEIYARNLYAGLANLFNQKKYRELLLFKEEARWPSNALVKTRLRIVWLLLKSRLLTYVG